MFIVSNEEFGRRNKRTWRGGSLCFAFLTDSMELVPSENGSQLGDVVDS